MLPIRIHHRQKRSSRYIILKNAEGLNFAFRRNEVDDEKTD